MEEIFFILIGIAWALGTPLIAIIALVRTSGLRAQNERLASELAAVRRQLAGGEVLPPPFAAPAVEPPTVPVEAMPPPGVPFEPQPETQPEPATVSIENVPSPAPTVAPVSAGWEQRLGARAFLWIGAITLALAAIFLVRYSIEEGYLSPEVRVILAALFGFAMNGGAERMLSN